jgi:membrane-associated phospholipid phosphatase
LILTFGMLISFAAGALSGPFPFRDLWLQSADAALGFDWAAYVAFISRYSLLAAALKLAYASLQPQFFLVGAVVALAGQRERLTIYTRAIGVTLAVTLVIFIFMPARAHGAGTWITALDYMRSAGPHAISFDDMNGIITFPSFHTQSACLFIWACWRMPYLRWPVLILNLALIAATPVDGVHYGVDVLAGVLIAVATIFLLSPKDTKAAIDIVSTNIGEAIGGTPVSARSVPID